MINVKQEIRKVFRFIQVKAKDDFYLLAGKKWHVGSMSYDEWFLEPYRKGRTERDDFDKNTLWEKSDTLEILQMFVDDGLIILKAK